MLESVWCDLAQTEASTSHIDYSLRLLFGNPQELGYRLQSFVSIAGHGNCLHHLITPLDRGEVGVHDREP